MTDKRARCSCESTPSHSPAALNSVSYLSAASSASSPTSIKSTCMPKRRLGMGEKPRPRPGCTGRPLVDCSSLCRSWSSRGQDGLGFTGLSQRRSHACQTGAHTACTRASCQCFGGQAGSFAEASNYLADAYETYSSSAQASQSFVRNILSAVFPLFAHQMVCDLARLSVPFQLIPVRKAWVSSSLHGGRWHRYGLGGRTYLALAVRSKSAREERCS